MTIKTLLILLVSIIPGIIWTAYFYRKDRYEPEPKYLIILSFLGGALAIIPAIMLEQSVSQYFLRIAELKNDPGFLMLGTLSIGLIEEGFKLFSLYWIALRSREFNEPVDGIIYGVSTGLGFAVVENLLYTTRYGLSVGLLRAVIGCLAHASFTGTAGYYWASAKFERDNAGYAYAILWPVAWHALYNYFLMRGDILRMFMALSIIAGVITFLLSKIRNMVRSSPFRN